MALKLEYFKKKQPVCSWHYVPDTQFFDVNGKISSEANKRPVKPRAIKAFGWLNVDNKRPPNWLKPVDNDAVLADNTMHWSEFNEFSLNIGDIKTVWELSRFDWLVNFAAQYLSTNDKQIIEKMNLWINDWCQHNPINQGVNWRCGQEASIRVMHVVSAIYMLEQQDTISQALFNFLFQHLMRISPTRFYAVAQDNNHGTSEACALFIGGLVLQKSLDNKLRAQGRVWEKQGRFWLENRAKHLIAEDGLFSQFSVNYHRLMLDTLSLAEQIRKNISAPKFSSTFYNKAKLASLWLYSLTDKTTGDVPNIGANDGAQILAITTCDYRDYRPSVQWAFNLFVSCDAYPPNGIYQQLTDLMSSTKSIDVEKSFFQTAIPAQRELASYVGLSTQVHALTCQHARVFIKTPLPTFRASSCDALHVDLWLGSVNLLCDAGSYSYNCEPELQHYFSSTQAHNTVQFDDREQMPKLSRFLYSNWIETKVSKVNEKSLTASYQDYRQCRHMRSLQLSTNNLIVIDDVANFDDVAILRWRLAASNWQLDGATLTSDLGELTIASENTKFTLALVDGLESRYYLQKRTIPVLEVTLRKAGTITTIINWSQ
ncbi:heparinase II/III family protein [Thalassotalea atypica]|uniref:heparinase II/III family protein n=1 Tax=Thalassotalea atypica TaxID=2054316 RepID=UPI002573CFA8|nr:heparinase II/III-family protein [Thalassotalea atypica]